MNVQLNIEVKDSLFDPDLPATSGKVHVRKKGAKTYYKVWLYLDGPDRPYIDSVTYTLHETFNDPVQVVRRTVSNPNCKMAFWSWGLFAVNATLLDKQGFSYVVTHELSYDKQFPSQSQMYVFEDDDPTADSRPTLVSAS
jgi:transcription initiation factor IIF auxiliary subunit